MERNHSYENAGYAAAPEGTNIINRVSWGAVLAGTVVMLVIVMLLNLLGIGIGLTSINPAAEQQPFSGLGTGALIWWIVSNLIAIFAGGYIAARLSGIPFGQNAVIHAFLSWCLFAVISAWLLTTGVGSVISGVGSVVTRTVSAVGSAVEMDVMSGQNNQGSLVKLANNLGSMEKQEIVSLIENRTDLSRAEAEQTATFIKEQHQNMQTSGQQSEQQAGNIADSAGSAAIWSFVALLVGAIVAAIAGIVGKPKGVLTPATREAV